MKYPRPPALTHCRTGGPRTPPILFSTAKSDTWFSLADLAGGLHNQMTLAPRPRQLRWNCFVPNSVPSHGYFGQLSVLAAAAGAGARDRRCRAAPPGRHPGGRPCGQPAGTGQGGSTRCGPSENTTRPPTGPVPMSGGHWIRSSSARPTTEPTCWRSRSSTSSEAHACASAGDSSRIRPRRSAQGAAWSAGPVSARLPCRGPPPAPGMPPAGSTVPHRGPLSRHPQGTQSAPSMTCRPRPGRTAGAAGHPLAEAARLSPAGQRRRGRPLLRFTIPKRDGSAAPSAPEEATALGCSGRSSTRSWPRSPAHDAAHGFVEGRPPSPTPAPHLGARSC